MPSSIIPRFIHFVWVGCPIPDKQASTVLAWALKNPKYTVVLWTNQAQANSTRLRNMLGLYHNYCETPEVSQQHNTIYNLSFFNKLSNVYSNIQVRSHMRLLGVLGELSTRYFNELENRSYGGASDILRICILEKWGGIYLDTDSDPLQPLPETLEAPDGILFGVFGAGKVFCNAVIAAPKDHQYLIEIKDIMTERYDYWERKGLLAMFRRGVEDARIQMNVAKENPGLNGIALATARANLQTQMQSGALLITGPARIAIWLYQHTGGTQSPLEWLNATMSDETKIKNNLKNLKARLLQRGKSEMMVERILRLEEQKGGNTHYEPITHLEQSKMIEMFQTLIIKPHLSRPEIHQTYAFPEGYVMINSEASWIK